jgi:hypothetical protein
MNQRFLEILEKAKKEFLPTDLRKLNELLPFWDNPGTIVGTRALTKDEKYVVLYCLNHEEESFAGLIFDNSSNSIFVAQTSEGPKAIFFNQLRIF